MSPIDQAEWKGDETQEYGDEPWINKQLKYNSRQWNRDLVKPNIPSQASENLKRLPWNIIPKLYAITPLPVHNLVQDPANVQFLQETFLYVLHNPPPDLVEFFRDQNTEKQDAQNTNHSLLQ
jgi:hypothetical protein